MSEAEDIARIRTLTVSVSKLPDAIPLDQLMGKLAAIERKQAQFLQQLGQHAEVLRGLRDAVTQVRALRTAAQGAVQDVRKAVDDAVSHVEGLHERLESGLEELLERVGELPEAVAERLTESIESAMDRVQDGVEARFEGVLNRVVESAIGTLAEQVTEAQVRSVVATQLSQVLAPYMPQMQIVRLGLPLLKRILNPVG